jgi:uncharacterized protein (DUF58 family)
MRSPQPSSDAARAAGAPLAGAGPLLRLGAPFAPAVSELAKAARVLQVRSRREVAGALVGGYRSAFRGGGVEFEESRPYAPGDDVRAIDWNAFARTGVAHVKRYREERDQTLLLLLDVSASMGFGTAGPSKAALAARTGALLGAAARAAGDRVALWTFDRGLVAEVPPGRGEAHEVRLLRALVAAGRGGAGSTALGPVLTAVRERVHRRAIVFILSDLRDDALLGAGATGRRTRSALAAVAHRHDVVIGWVRDPREAALPAAGTLRVADPEAPGRTLLLRSGSRRARERYARAARAGAHAQGRELIRLGADVLPLATDADPLRTLGRFFVLRAAARARGRGVRP